MFCFIWNSEHLKGQILHFLLSCKKYGWDRAEFPGQYTTVI